MLCLEIAAPEDLVIELVVVRLKQLDSLGIRHMAEIGGHDVVQAVDEALVDKLVEECHFLRRTGSVSISSRKKSRINEILDSVYPKIKTDAAIPTSNASSPFSFFSKRARKTAAIPIIPIFIIDITYETGFPSL